MPGDMFGAGRGATYVALSSGPRDTPQRVLMTPTQRVFVPQLKSLPHTQQIPPPGPRVSSPPPPVESQQRRAECLWGNITQDTASGLLQRPRHVGTVSLALFSPQMG